MVATPSSSPSRTSAPTSPSLLARSSSSSHGSRLAAARGLQQSLSLPAAESVQSTPMETLARKRDGSFAIFATRAHSDGDDEDDAEHAKYEESQRLKLQQRGAQRRRLQHDTTEAAASSAEATVNDQVAPLSRSPLRSMSPMSFRRAKSSLSPAAAGRDSELVQHIRELRRALSDDLEMEHGVREHRQGKAQRGISSGGHPLDREAREHGVDFELLRDLRAAFCVYNSQSASGATSPHTATTTSIRGTNSDSIQGIPEAEFIRIFGSAIGGFTSDEVLRAWCRQMDSRCAGVLSWRDLSNYLVKSATNNAWLTRHAHHQHRGGGDAASPGVGVNNNSLGNHPNTSNGSFLGGSGSSFSQGSNKSFSGAFAVSHEDTLMEWQRDLCGDRQLEGRSVQSKGHNSVVTHLLALPSVHSIISASNDGSLRRWDQWTLDGDAKPMHVSNEWITGLAKVNGMNRVGVLHSDRSIFFYDLTMPSKSSVDGRQQGPAVVADYYRGFAQSSNVFIQTLTQPAVGQKAVGSSLIRKRAPGEAPSRPPLPVTLIAPKKAPSTAFCHIQSTPVVETVILGNGDGSLEMLCLRIAESYDTVVAPTFELPAVHRGRVAQVTYAPELDSVITAGSTDGVVMVTSLEHLVTTQSMHSDIDHRQAKTIQQFDYRSEYHHMLVHGYGRNIFIWNALTGMRNHSITDIDRVVLQCALNADRHRLYALTDDKTIKVYDVRTWKCIDSVSDDRALRVPVNAFAAMIFSDATSMVVTAATNPVAWRTDEAQKMIEDSSNSIPAAGAGAGLMSPSHRMMLKSSAAAARNKKKKLTKSDPIHTLLCLLPQCQVITVDTDNVVQVWSTQSTRRLIKWRWPYPSSVMCAAVSHQGRQLMVGADDGSMRSVSIGTGALCWSLDHPCGHGAGFEVSACYLAHHSPIPNHSLLFAAIGRHIVAWLYDEDTPINPSSSIALKQLPHWRTLQLPVDYGIVHSFSATGPDGLCYYAASNSGYVVGFNLHIQLLYVVPPPSQIAAELLYRLSAKVTALSYSDGMLSLVRGDVSAHKSLFAPFRATWREGHTITSISSAKVMLQASPMDYHNPHHARRLRAEAAERGEAHLVAVGDSSGHVTLFVVGDVPVQAISKGAATASAASLAAKHSASDATTTASGRRAKRKSNEAGGEQNTVGPRTISDVSTTTANSHGDSAAAVGEFRVRAVWAWQAHDDAAVSGLHFFDPDAPHSSAELQQQQRSKKNRRGEEDRVELSIPQMAGGTHHNSNDSGGVGGDGSIKFPPPLTVSIVSSCADGSLREWSVLWCHDPPTSTPTATTSGRDHISSPFGRKPPKMGTLHDPHSSNTAAPGARRKSGREQVIVFESDMGVASLQSSSSSSSSCSSSGAEESDGSDEDAVSATHPPDVAVPSPTTIRRVSSHCSAVNVARQPPLVEVIRIVDVKHNALFGKPFSGGGTKHTAGATAPSALIPSPSSGLTKVMLPSIGHMSPSSLRGGVGNGSMVNFVMSADPGDSFGDHNNTATTPGAGLDNSGNTPPFSLVSPMARKASSFAMSSSMLRRSPPQRTIPVTPPKGHTANVEEQETYVVRNVVQQHAFVRLQQQQLRGGGGALAELPSFTSVLTDAGGTNRHGPDPGALHRRLSKRFLTFSNLLDAADRTALFEGTPQHQHDDTSTTTTLEHSSLSPRVVVDGTTRSGDAQQQLSLRSALSFVGGAASLMSGALSPLGSASQPQRRMSSFHQQHRGSFSSSVGLGGTLSPVHQTSPLGGDGSTSTATGTTPATSPASVARKRFATRYASSTSATSTPMSKGSEAHTLMVVSELQRPLSRVSALRRIHGREDDDDNNNGTGNGGDVVNGGEGSGREDEGSRSSSTTRHRTSPTNGSATAHHNNRPSLSVERRLASVHRRREERHEAEFVQGFQPYFGKVALQLFDGEREQLEKEKDN